jgi:hypothetical protein
MLPLVLGIGVGRTGVGVRMDAASGRPPKTKLLFVLATDARASLRVICLVYRTLGKHVSKG